MLQITKNVTYCGESYIESNGTHVVLSNMSAVITDDTQVSLTRNITLNDLYDTYKDIIEEDWEEFEEDIEEVVGHVIERNPSPFEPDVESGPEEEDGDGDSDSPTMGDPDYDESNDEESEDDDSSDENNDEDEDEDLDKTDVKSSLKTD